MDFVSVNEVQSFVAKPVPDVTCKAISSSCAVDLPLSILTPALILSLFLNESPQIDASVEAISFSARIADPPVIVEILSNLTASAEQG